MEKIKKIFNIKEMVKILISLCLISMVLYLSIGTVDIIVNFKSYLDFSTVLYKFGNILFILYLIYKLVNKEFFKLKDIIIILLGLFAYFSYKYAIDPNVALNGLYGRNEGLYVILAYYIIFLSSSCLDKKYQKIVIIFLLITGFFQVFVGSLQFFKVKYIFGYDRSNNFSNRYSFASGTLGNPNFYATYVLMCLVYCYVSFINSKQVIKKIIYITLSLCFLYGLLIGDTLGCFLAFIIIVFITIIKLINRKNIFKVLISCIIFIVFGIISINLIDNKFDTNIKRRIEKNKEQIIDIFENGIDDDTGNGRVYVWRQTLKMVPDNILNGIGIDNFGVVDDGGYFMYIHDDGLQLFDKVHNEYLQKLITEGLFSFITYIGLLVYVFIKYIKNRSDELKYSLFLVFLAYLIQATFNISVITVAPIFYMIMGFICNELLLDN